MNYVDSINYNLANIGESYCKIPLPTVHPQDEMSEEEKQFAEKYNDFLNKIQREFV